MDLGANHGTFSKTISQRYGCECHCVEPNPEVWKGIETGPLIHTYNLAATEQDAPIRLHISSNSESSSTLPLASEPQAPVVEVEGLTLASLIDRLKLPRVDFLKVDIEGAETGLFRSCGDELLTRIPQISVEFHEMMGLTRHDEMLALFARMSALGFEVIKMSLRHYADVLFINTELTGVSRNRARVLRHFDRNVAVLGRALRQYGLR